MSIRFFHLADIHLESPFSGIHKLPEEWQNRLRSASFDAFERVIEDAKYKRPDFILIAGDIYDGENRSLHAQRFFQRSMERLAELKIPVFVIHGNHDHLGGKWTRFELPDTVYVFGECPHSHVVKVNGQTVQISGFSYPTRHVHETYSDNYPLREPLADYAIGLLHGSERSQVEHDVYAPFTVQDLLKYGYDYWALGHIHKRQTLHQDPMIAYSGTLQARNLKEKGPQGYLDIRIDGNQTSSEFCQVSTLQFESLETLTEEPRSIDLLLKELLADIDQQSWREEYILLDWTISLSRLEWLDSISDDELRDYISSQIQEVYSNILVTRLQIRWIQQLEPVLQELVEELELPDLPLALEKYIQKEQLQLEVQERIQTLLAIRGNQL
ncbi:DNA repair exonuclease [Chryseomicrobium excrementi]|uniref:DNA repair exonuclease n=1 Tax=Chryseomicrobium excrementi TaxID=2041346 RepID=A0A2M9F3S9_9BACL|nr:DNA repair exonuclease [Chryseomicrobium excrementi]PJK18121.1 DNA repair exonuclease [Chryseomicrobium excrementi]